MLDWAQNSSNIEMINLSGSLSQLFHKYAIIVKKTAQVIIILDNILIIKINPYSIKFF